jgi:hypothetical protein
MNQREHTVAEDFQKLISNVSKRLSTKIQAGIERQLPG